MFKYFFFVILWSVISGFAYSQNQFDINHYYQDTNFTLRNTKSNLNPSGVFVAPFIGLDYPVTKFGDNSVYGFSYGIKLEFASKNIYPFILYGFYQYQRNPGKDSYKTLNLLNSMDTKLNTFGCGIYFLLNKYFKYSFTSPFLIGEIKYITAKRVISPDNYVPELNRNESLLSYSAGFGFTIFIFDLLGTYNFAKDYSSFSIKAQFHYPLIKF